MGMVKIIFIYCFFGSYETYTVYVRENQVVVFAENNEVNYTYWILHDLNKNIKKTIDKNKNMTTERLKMENEAQWIAYPPLSYIVKDSMTYKEYKDEKLYVKTETKFSSFVYELASFPIKNITYMNNFFENRFDEKFPLVISKKELNQNGQEFGTCKLESIKSISETEFNEVLAKFND